MEIIYDKEIDNAIDTETGASLSPIKSRKEETEYLFKTGSDIFLLSSSYTFEGRGSDGRSLRPKKKNIFVTSLNQIVDFDAKNFSYERLNHHELLKVDYRAHMIQIKHLLLIYQTRGRPDWPTEIIINFPYAQKLSNIASER